MRIRRIAAILVLVISLAGCSVQHKLIREYKGKTKADLVLGMGKPLHIETGERGQTIHIYVRNKLLKAALINTGQFQYDKFESPKTVKTETYRFFLNSSGVVEDVTYELSYAR